MSTLVVDEMFPGVVFTQTIKIDRTLAVGHIRPWIYKHGNPTTGELTMRVYDGATLLSTVSIAAADINAGISDTYAHGFLRFDFDPLILHLPEGVADYEYTIEVEMTNYVLDTGNFIGVVRAWENQIYPLGVTLPNSMVAPLGLEIYEYKML